jgi:hypothetical protein
MSDQQRVTRNGGQRESLRSYGSLQIVALLALGLTGCARQMTLQEWKGAIDKELPVGTRRADVERFLDAHGAPRTFIGFAGQERVAACIKSNDRKSHPDIQLSFRFNADHQLVSYDAREVLLGP